MPKDLRQQIENHLALCPEWRNDALEMKKEWEEYKRKAMWVLLGFSGSILAIGIWVGAMQTNIENINQEHSKNSQKVETIETRIGVLEVNNGEIRSRLASIEVTLQEIKAAIIKLQ